MHDIRPYLPRLFAEPGTLLYIGCRPDAHSWLPELHAAGHIIDVLEVWAGNTEGLRNDRRLRSIFLGDVRDIAGLPPGLTYDYIFWWHGPEHLDYGAIWPTLQAAEARARRLVAIAAPWGVYPQGAHNGNEYETHRCSLYPQDFAKWGYETATDGAADQPGSEVVGWKWLGGYCGQVGI